jgi:hypothetical protein
MDTSGLGRRRSVPSVGVSRDGQARLTSRPTVGEFGRSRHQRAKDPTAGFLSAIVNLFRRSS